MGSSTSSSKSSAYAKRKRRLITGFIGKALIFVPLLIPLVAVNYLIDPASIFKSDASMKSIASLLLQGKNVAILWDYDSRLLQKFYLEGLTRKNDVVVFGSSRTLQINAKLFPGKVFFNNAVSASTLNDYIGILEMYREKGLLPDTVVLGVDPWIFNKNNNVPTWKILDSYAYAFFSVAGLYGDNPVRSIGNDLNIRASLVNRYLQLFSISYFQASLHRMRSLIKDNEKQGDLLETRFYPTDKMELDDAIKLADGSMVYQKIDRDRSVPEVLQNVKAAFILDNFSRQAFSAIDPELAKEFEVFVLYLLKNNIRVILWLAPYHPYAYDYLVTHDKYAVMKDVESYVRSFALRNNILLVGSYDPRACNCGEEQFYDAIHPKREAVVRLFNASLRGAQSN